MSILSTETTSDHIARSAVDVRDWIVSELSRSLNVDPYTIDAAAPLDSLGVDSLAAIGMTGGLAGWLNRDLPATLMWDYPTIDAIAEALADKAEPALAPVRPGVVDLQPRGDRRPIFFFPGLRGHPVTFSHLALHLGTNQPCYGLSVPGLNGEREPFKRVEDIAATMLKSIRLVQPKGPYQLAGYSFGGLLAYETAQQLISAGETVSLLAIYDTFTRTGRNLRPFWQRFALRSYMLLTQSGRLKYLRDRLRARRSVVQPKIAEIEAATEDVANPHEPTLIDVRYVNSLAAENYQPREYPSSVLLFRASDRAAYNLFYKMDADNGWSALADGRVEVINLRGSHADLLSADRAEAAAAMLRPHLSANAA